MYLTEKIESVRIEYVLRSTFSMSAPVSVQARVITPVPTPVPTPVQAPVPTPVQAPVQARVITPVHKYTRVGAKWTEAELDYVFKMSGRPLNEIAKSLGRSIQGVAYGITTRVASELCTKSVTEVVAKYGNRYIFDANVMRLKKAAAAIRKGSSTAIVDFNLSEGDIEHVNKINHRITVTKLQQALGVSDRKLIERLIKNITAVADASTIKSASVADLLMKISSAGFRPY